MSRISKPTMSSFEEKQRGRERTGYGKRCRKKEIEGKDSGMRGTSRDGEGERRWKH